MAFGMNISAILDEIVDSDTVCVVYYPTEFKILQETKPYQHSFEGFIELQTFFEKCHELATLHETWAEVLNIILRVILVVGFVFNSFSLAILLSDKCSTSTDVYLTSVTFGDLMACASAAISTQLPTRFINLPVLILAQIAGNLGLFACITTIMMFTMERYMVIKDPLSSLHACSRGRSLKIVAGIWAILIIYSTAVVFIMVDFDNEGQGGGAFHLSRGSILFYINFVIFYIIPMAVTLTEYILILKQVKNRRREFEAINQDASGRHSNIGAVANNASAQIKSTPDQGGASSVHQESNNAKGKVSTSTNASYASTAQHDPAVASMQARANQQSSNGDYEPQAQTDSFKRMVNRFILLLVSFLVLMSPYRMFSLIMSVAVNHLGVQAEGFTFLLLKIAEAIVIIVFATNSIVHPILYNFLTLRFRWKVEKQLQKLRNAVKCKRFGSRSANNHQNQPIQQPPRSNTEPGVKIMMTSTDHNPVNGQEENEMADYAANNTTSL